MPWHGAANDFLILEWMHVRGINCRGLRLELFAGLVIALMLFALSAVAAHAQESTTTTLTAETSDQSGRTQATVAVVVTGEDGLPATGAVTLSDNGKSLAGVALNAQGQATTVLDLASGDHTLRASYVGNATSLASTSKSASVHALATSGTFDFQISVVPTSLTLAAGKAGNIVVTITPENYSTLGTDIRTVGISCSGLPQNASCTSTPTTVNITADTTTAPTSTMVIQTQAATTSSVSPANRPGRGSNPIAWAFLLPGVLGLGGIAWGTRRRRGPNGQVLVRGAVSRWFGRFSLVALVGLVTLMGTTACSPRYSYYNHGPSTSSATPAGTYTVKVTGQTSDGVTATTHSTTFALTVN